MCLEYPNAVSEDVAHLFQVFQLLDDKQPVSSTSSVCISVFS